MVCFFASDMKGEKEKQSWGRGVADEQWDYTTH